ncbi:hypothetical protein C8F01DRAFT_1092879 [Mycena amicta]|nr:hypothetical protein C8F01DRAFT_1092879 [Mycena amicta]
MLSFSPLLQLVLVTALCGSVFAATDFDWDSVQPSTELDWTPCYDAPLECARLIVPLDYSHPVCNASTAMIRFPATSDPSEYRGPLIFNPGGPGGSGVETLIEVGALFASIFGSEFDIASASQPPAASTFLSGAEAALWNAGAPLSLNASSDSVARTWGLAQVQGTLAAQRDACWDMETSDDGQRRARYAPHDAENGIREAQVLWDLVSTKRWIHSGKYGTVLGATFAAMFPDKIERVILDGVVDAEGWYQANLTLSASATDATLNSFFTGCAAAGPTLCAFATNASNTPQELSDRLTALTNAIRAQPVPVVTPAGYGLVDYSLLRQTIFGALYSPYTTFSTLAQALVDLEAGNGATLFNILTLPQFQCNVASNSTDAGIGVLCGDAVEVHDTLEELTAFYHNAARLSQFAEFLVGWGRVTCSGWKVYREDRFKGPVAAANTSASVAIRVHYSCALKTIANFPGSVLLTQDSPGHTSTSAPSLCTLGYFNAYMINGTLPPPGTICTVDTPLFGDEANATARGLTRSEEDERAIEALTRVREVVLGFVSTAAAPTSSLHYIVAECFLDPWVHRPRTRVGCDVASYISRDARAVMPLQDKMVCGGAVTGTNSLFSASIMGYDPNTQNPCQARRDCFGRYQIAIATPCNAFKNRGLDSLSHRCDRPYCTHGAPPWYRDVMTESILTGESLSDARPALTLLTEKMHANRPVILRIRAADKLKLGNE